MAYGRREGCHMAGCHYLDGIPVKISERFRPPRKITLPLSYQQRYPVDLLNDEYDFTLENQVLEMAEARRKAKKATEHAKAEKLGTSIEEFTRVVPNEPKNPLNSVNWNSTNNSNGKNSSDETPCVDNSSRPKNDGCHSEHTDLPPNDSKNGFVMGVPSSKLPSLEPNSMLKPVPSSSGPLVSGKPDVTITSKLNLEDFEAESSPFDSIALKTLNDLEELESVLQNVNLNSTVIHEIQTGPSPDLSSELSGVLHTCNNDIVGKTEESPLHNIPADDVCDLKICNTSTALESQQAFFPGPSPVAKDFPSIPSTPPHWPPTMIESSSCSADDYSSVAGSYSASPFQTGASYSPTIDSLPTQLSPNEEMYTCVVALQNSQSTPDLLKELGSTLSAEREKKKNQPNVVQSKRIGSSSNNGAEIGSDTPSSEFDVGHQQNTDLKDKGEMDEDTAALVRHIVDMGFPVARVERAVRTFRGDHKKIIDHLCMVHSFIEMGYAVEDAEMAVFSPIKNEMQVKEYLDVVIQLRDLGFDERSIQEALAQCDNDRDKALDLLLS